MQNPEMSNLFTLGAAAATCILVTLGLAAERGATKATAAKGPKKSQNKSNPNPSAAAEKASEKTQNALAFLQYAKDQAAQAESACSRAGSGSKDSRLAAAEQAGYHAQAAREAAGNATSAAEGGPDSAKNAAAQSRDVAARAQAAADRARYNAATAR